MLPSFGALRRHLPRVDRVALGLAVVFVAMLAFAGYTYSATTLVASNVERLGSTDHDQFNQAWQFRYLDQELTLAATRYIDASPTDRIAWKSRYNTSATELDRLFAEAESTRNPVHLDHLQAVKAANDVLTVLETEMFTLADSGHRTAARAVLGGAYDVQKDAYRHGLDEHFAAQEGQLADQINDAVEEMVGLRTMAVLALAVILSALVFISGIHRVEKRQARDRDGEREAFADRQRRQAKIHDGFEMSLTESEALYTFESALTQELIGWRTEVLLADSSTAHLQRAVRTHPDEQEPTCCVATPMDCPAIRRGSTLTFTDTDGYASCPNMRDRDIGNGTAVCVPLKVMGKTIGVSHSLAPTAPTADTLDRLTEIVRAGGDRLGVLRAFAATRQQATRDPLTGLLNRRSLEDEAHKLDDAGRQYSVVFCDLDNFKSLNDTRGHASGDKALRRFAETMRTTLRPTDIAARWGGEEFVVVMPDTSAQQAVEAIERVRQSLALALMNAEIPRFTFSAGVTDATGLFDLRTAIADGALLEAKRRGRDRVVRSDRVEVSEPADDEQMRILADS